MEVAEDRAEVGVRLRERVALLKSCRSVADAQRIASGIGGLINMPRVIWAPDIAYPYLIPAVNDFALEQGWPEELIALWWKENLAIRIPYYIRCRVESFPFVTELYGAPSQRAANALERRVIEICRNIGLRTLVTVPVHLPRGVIAMLTWAGGHSGDQVREIVSAHETELLCAAHFFIRAAQAGDSGPFRTQEDFSKLTIREWDCLRLTAQGFRDREVAELQGISSTTVRYHLDNVIEKLGAVNRIHAVALAAQLGLLGR